MNKMSNIMLLCYEYCYYVIYDVICYYVINIMLFVIEQCK